jgi:hypothetical protein
MENESLAFGRHRTAPLRLKPTLHGPRKCGASGASPKKRAAAQPEPRKKAA